MSKEEKKEVVYQVNRSNTSSKLMKAEVEYPLCHRVKKKMVIFQMQHHLAKDFVVLLQEKQQLSFNLRLCPFWNKVVTVNT